MKRLDHRVTFFLEISIALMLIACSNSATEERAIKEISIQPKKGPIEGILKLNGVVRSANRLEIRSDKAIKVAKVHVANFSNVKKGQLLIEIDKTELTTKLQDLMDRMKALKLEENSSKAKFDHSTKVLSRKQSLLSKGIIAQKEYDEAFREFKLGESDLKAKALELEKSGRELTEIEAQLKSSNFYAPIDGMVSGLLSADDGTKTEVSAGKLLAVVSDPTSLALWVQIEETNVHRVRVGQAAILTLDAVPQSQIIGKVLELSVSTSENPASRIKTYDMSIEFNQKIPTVREGFRGKAQILYARKESALSVPLQALRYLDGKDYLVVVNSLGTSSTPKQVQLGLKTETEAEVLSGLSENDLIMVEATN